MITDSGWLLGREFQSFCLCLIFSLKFLLFIYYSSSLFFLSSCFHVLTQPNLCLHFWLDATLFHKNFLVHFILGAREDTKK